MPCRTCALLPQSTIYPGDPHARLMDVWQYGSDSDVTTPGGHELHVTLHSLNAGKKAGENKVQQSQDLYIKCVLMGVG